MKCVPCIKTGSIVNISANDHVPDVTNGVSVANHMNGKRSHIEICECVMRSATTTSVLTNNKNIMN